MSMDPMEDPARGVAMACRLLQRAELIHHSGHISVRDPEGGFWIHGRLIPRQRVNASHVVHLDEDYNVVAGTVKPPMESPIHGEIYRVRPDVQAIAHLHSPMATLVGVLKGVTYMPVMNHGTLFADGVPVFEDSRHVTKPDAGQRLAAVLGQHRAALMRGHGAVVVGRSLQDCFKAALYFEDNARFLWQALAAGGAQPLPPDESEYGYAFLNRTSPQKVWDYYEAFLEDGDA